MSTPNDEIVKLVGKSNGHSAPESRRTNSNPDARGSNPWKAELSRMLRSKATRIVGACLVGAIAIRGGVNWYLHRNLGEQVPVVRVVTPVVKPIDQVLELPGNIEAIEQASLYSHVSGYLKKIYVDEGDHVKKDQLLADIDAPDAVQEYAKAKAEFNLKDVTRKRYTELLKEQVVSQQEFDTVAADADESRARLDNALATLSYTKIHAPFDGSIARRFKYPGDLISTATRGGNQNPIFVLVNERKLRVAANVPQIDAASIVVGHPATVKVDTLQGKEFQGEVSRIDALLDEATKTQRVLVDLDNPDGVLHAGSFATVRLELMHRDRALLIPKEAVIQEGGSSMVYRLVDGHLKKTTVTTGYSDATFFDVTNGLNDSDSVVLPGSFVFTDGMAVKPMGKGN